MDASLCSEVARQVVDFRRRFAPLFGRTEARRRSEQYLRGLLVQQTDRRNAENLAEAVPGATPRALQRFLTEAPWDAAAVVAELQACVADRLSAPDAVFVLDETGFPKVGPAAQLRRHRAQGLPVQRAGGHPAGHAGLAAGDALAGGAGDQGGQGRAGAGPLRGARLARLAPPHGDDAAGPPLPGPATVPVGGRRRRR